ncbi:hypothetical protein SADUNF_Sadunf11G0069400 [Salix dunnii]|uniref:Uncharacterized protein n=1 Tax=Salix dunnii TaxID=1413687 RepID=A0A835JQI4_9ROSI|nr:hypothetical protein SADUNF_Sadunf11G0069400 [Salix dunnii]
MDEAAVHKSKTIKRGRSGAREEQVAVGVALVSQPSTDVAIENANRVDFTSSSSDPMIGEVTAVVGKWEIVNQKKHRSRNVQQTAAKGVGSMGVGSAIPLGSGVPALFSCLTSAGSFSKNFAMN